MPRNSSINFNKSFNSFSIFSRSKPVKRRNFISRIALAWISLNLKLFIKPVLASSSDLAALINLITASILSSAIFKPSKIWTRFSATSKSYLVLLIITSRWKSIYLTIISFKHKVFGTPWSNIKNIIPYVVWNEVCLYNLFKTTWAFASFFKVIVILIPFFKSEW